MVTKNGYILRTLSRVDAGNDILSENCTKVSLTTLIRWSLESRTLGLVTRKFVMNSLTDSNDVRALAQLKRILIQKLPPPISPLVNILQSTGEIEGVKEFVETYQSLYFQELERIAHQFQKMLPNLWVRNIRGE